MNIISNGTLYINTNLPSGKQSNTTGNPANGSNTTTEICGAKLNLTDGGTISIGTSSHSTSDVYINSNATIDMDYDGGTNANLNIENGSKLVIGTEGFLKIGEGATIALNGNAILEIQGTLDLAANATFTFSGSGKVIFNGVVPNNIQFANNSKIEIIGNGASHVAVEIHQVDLYALTNNNASATNSIHFEDCKILMANDARFSTDIPIELRSVTVDRLTSGDQPRGFEFWGQEGVEIAGCSFSHCRYGIRSNSHVGGASITIKNSSFSYCKYGLYTIGAGANISSSSFNNNSSHGWAAKGMYFNSKITDSYFNNNIDDGINYAGSSIAGLSLYRGLLIIK